MAFFPLIGIVLIILLKLPPHWSMFLGITLALSINFDDHLRKKSKDFSAKILQFSIILLGAGLNFSFVINEGPKGVLITFISITSILITGYFLAKALKIPSPLSTLITVGTSICGGSAISAVSTVIRPDSFSMAISLAIVFILNAISIFVFTSIGQFLDLSGVQFGTWAALAIHDTSSVVAACIQYGQQALEIGTTLKLTRALWIIPLTVLFSFTTHQNQKINIPWFIILFLINSLLFTFYTDLSFLTPYLSQISKLGFSISLFLIGLTLNKSQLKLLNLRIVTFSVTLWLFAAFSSLLFVWYYYKSGAPS